MPVEPSATETYRTRGWSVVRGAVGPMMASHLASQLSILQNIGRLRPDPQAPPSHSVYGDPGFDALLPVLSPTVEEVTGTALMPSYSFARVYWPGSELVEHTDRAACEHSVTLHLAADDGDAPWPISLTGLDGIDADVVLEPGDALIYQGINVAHRRGRFSGQWYAQVFLHYVAAAGPHADHALDGRDRLGTPSVRS